MSADTFDDPGIVGMLFELAKRADPMIGENFDPVTLGQALRDELPVIRDSGVPEETYAVLVGITAVLIRHGADALLAKMPKHDGKPPSGPLLTLIKGGKA